MNVLWETSNGSIFFNAPFIILTLFPVSIFNNMMSYEQPTNNYTILDS